MKKILKNILLPDGYRSFLLLANGFRNHGTEIGIFSHQNHCFFQFVVVSLRQEVIDDL